MSLFAFTVRSQALWTEPEAIFGALNHCACRTNLGLPGSSRSLDIDDDRRLRVYQVVVRIYPARENGELGKMQLAGDDQWRAWD
jgi:hypothetical protein